MTGPRQLSWENFRSQILKEGQRVHRISLDPRIDVFADAEKGNIGAILELSEKDKIPAELLKLEYIKCSVVKENKENFLQISSSSLGLQRQFYQFVTAVADRIILEDTKAIPALLAELKCFDDLLASQVLLSAERQLGLLGELLVLDAFLDLMGSSAVESWTGPAGEPHDFRINKYELEVKTTSGSRRLHYIHGLDQLSPSQGMDLFLISILLEPAGKANGLSLASMVEKIRARILPDSLRTKRLDELLVKTGLKDSELILYPKQWRLRRPIAHIPIDKKFPKISRPDISAILGGRASRIDYLEYSVNVEGLGTEKTDFRYFTGIKTL